MDEHITLTTAAPSAGSTADPHLPQEHDSRLRGLMLADFGEHMAPAGAPLPPRGPSGLRWTTRGDGRSGFLFVDNHRPDEPLPDHRDVRFHLERSDGTTLSLPGAPVTIPSGTRFCWPFGLEIGGLRFDYATAQPVCRVDDDGRQVLVLAAVDGIAPELALDADTVASEWRVGLDTLVAVETTSGTEVAVLLLDTAAARTAHRGEAWGAERLVLCADGVTFEDGSVRLSGSAAQPSVAVFPAPKRSPSVPGADVLTSVEGALTRYTLVPHDGERPATWTLSGQ